jgi:AbiV family abortive infection protein
MKNEKEPKTSYPSDGVLKTIIMNGLCKRKPKKIYLEMYLETINESYRLVKEAEILFNNKCYQRAYFLGFSALEEISKSQLAADVYTNLITESEFKKIYRNHKEKIARVKWIQIDGNLYPCFRYDGIRIRDFDFQKKLKSMYVDADFSKMKISSPQDSASKEDAESIIKAVSIGLSRIYEITEINGEQIGTKGFMK